MSIDNSPTKTHSSQSDPTLPSSSEAGLGRHSLDWPSLVLGKSKSPGKVFGDAVSDGGVYRWGMGIAMAATMHGPGDNGAGDNEPGADEPGFHEPGDDEGDSPDWDQGDEKALLHWLSRLGCDQTPKSKSTTFDWTATAQQAIRRFRSLKDPTAEQAAMAVVWAAAIPRLQASLDVTVLADLTHALLELREAILLRSDVCSTSHLILGGELGLTLAWRMPGLRSRAAILQSAGDAVSDWALRDEGSVSAAVAGAASVRVVLASLIRCRGLMKVVAKREFTKQNMEVAELLATWVAAMTVNRGTSAFSSAEPKDVKDDCGKHGLFSAAKELDPNSLGLAIDAAMGKGHSGGRLAWEVSLPESMWCDDSSKIAILLPEWDASRGRTHVDYSGQDVDVEIFAGRSAMISGRLQSSLEIEGVKQQPTGDWEEICRYTDDDVHYLELEQAWTSDYLIQRQFLLIREDRCLMFADAVIPRKVDAAIPANADQPNSSGDVRASEGILAGKIDYQVSLPLAQNAAAIEEQETRDVMLRSTGGKSDGNQAMLLPLSASEWKMGPTKSKLILADPDRVVFQASGRGRLYAPLWIDFYRRRLKRMRTWRTLTVCDALQLVPTNDAAAFRIQVGSEQWAIYRSLNDQRCRSFLGKHIMADFYVSRFETGDGTHDALITVDDTEDDH